MTYEEWLFLAAIAAIVILPIPVLDWIGNRFFRGGKSKSPENHDQRTEVNFAEIMKWTPMH